MEGLTDAELAEIEAAEGITCRASIMGGTPVFAGTRIPLSIVLVTLADTEGLNPAKVLAEFEGLTEKNLRDALEYASLLTDQIAPLLAELRRLRAELDQAEGEVAGWQSRYESLLEDKVKAYYDLEAANAELRRLRGMKCETCEHWEDRSCDKGTVCGDVDCEGCEDEHRHDCKLMFRPGTPEHPESLAVAHDCEDYGAWVQTKPDFGCVCWRVKTCST